MNLHLCPHLHPAPQKITPTGQTVPTSALMLVDPRIDPDEVAHPQGYTLTIGSSGVTLVGHDDAGLFYGRQTLDQLRAAYPKNVPSLSIEDWPDLITRGYMLDCSRDRLPTLATVLQLVDKLARLKINQFQLYTEHTVAYVGHEAAWRDASPFTFDELATIQAHCNERFIDLVPCQNVFGHMERWLKKSEYVHLAECPDGYDTPWGFRSPDPCSLSPAVSESFELSADLIDQLAEKSNSTLFNIGCDETLDLGQGKSKALCDEKGKATVYLDYLQKLCGRVESHGKTPIFFGDVILNHPELIERIPKNAVLVNWNYESTKSFMEESKQFQKAGVRFYVCPGTSSWCTLTGRGQNTIGNLRDGAEAAVACGAEGYLITEWGDHGNWQPSAIQWLGLTYGAGVAWSLNTNRNIDTLPDAISRIAADETTGELGAILWQLSNAYESSDVRFSNATWWFRFLHSPENELNEDPLQKVSVEAAQSALTALKNVLDTLARYAPATPEAQLLKREMTWSAQMARWACLRAAERLAGASLTVTPCGDGQFHASAEAFNDLLTEFQALWLLRSRPGGLTDSIEKLTKVLRVADASTHDKVGSWGG
ncbi:MAG: family 20 glycosylhydrolase [Algisphaera sp.]